MKDATHFGIDDVSIFWISWHLIELALATAH
jgi:hypothetical protein